MDSSVTRSALRKTFCELDCCGGGELHNKGATIAGRGIDEARHARLLRMAILVMLRVGAVLLLIPVLTYFKRLLSWRWRCPQNRKAASRRPLRNSIGYFDQAAARAAEFFRFLRRVSRPSAPRPEAKRGRAAGSGMLDIAVISSSKTLDPDGAAEPIPK